MTEEHLPGPKPHLRIEGYEILREIGRGGQAFVYQARQETTNRKVAINVLRKFAEANDEAAARFVREIRLMAQLSHPPCRFHPPYPDNSTTACTTMSWNTSAVFRFVSMWSKTTCRCAAH